MVGLLVGLAGSASADRPSDYWSAQTKTATFSGVVDATTLWTPASGKRIILQGCAFNTIYAGKIRVQSAGTDVIPPQDVESSGQVQIHSGGAIIWSGDIDATLTYSVSEMNAFSGSIMCWGYEAY